ncbi:MAG: hypothetical protein IT204_12375 [Fimbriimonadaceae bacterium]|nr:hypothetical protein [Fimbriimonadaceae bacterium]
MGRRRGCWLLLAMLLGGPLRAAWQDDYAAAQRLYQPGAAAADLDAVVALSERALLQQPPARRVPEVQYLLGRAAYDRGLAAQALAALRAAVAARPEVPEYRLWLGYASWLDGRPTLAIRLFQALLAESAAPPEVRKSALTWLGSLHEPPELRALEPGELLTLPGARLRHHRGEAAAATVRQALEAARATLLERLGISLDEPVEVVLFRDLAEYQEYHRQRQIERPEWSTACTVNGRIFTYPAAGEHDALVATLTHEYTHVALRAYADDRVVPTWVDEGVAVLLSNQFGGTRPALRQAPQLLSLRALLVPTFSAYETGVARLAYLQSRAMVEDLLRQHGAVKLRAWLRALGQGQEAGEAFEAVYGLAMGAWYDTWFREGLDAN